MYRRVVFILLFFSFYFLSAVEFYDDLNNKISLDHFPRKIVSLAPNITETIFLLNREDLLVGRTSACDYPAGVEKIPIIASYKGIDVEKLMSLKPEIAILSYNFKGNFLSQLQALSIPIYYTKVDSISDIFKFIENLSILLNARERGNFVIDSLHDELNKILLHKPKSKRVFLELCQSPLMTVNDGTFVGNAIKILGLKNIFSTARQEYPAISIEKVIAKDPDVIFILHEGSINDILHRTGWSNVKAIKNEQVYFIKPDLLLRPSYRIFSGMKEIEERLR